MAENKFCPGCGTKREAGSRFCVGCGAAFGTQRHKPLLWGLVAVALLTLIGYGLIGLISAKKTPTVASAAVTDTHSASKPAHIVALEARAATGSAAALMDLAEAQLKLSVTDEDYLFQAATTLEKILASYPDHAYSLRLLGNVYFQMGASQQAVTHYAHYLEHYPDDVNVRTDMGTQLLGLNRTEEAIAAFEQALRQYPDFYNACFNLYVVYRNLGDTEKADYYRQESERIKAKVGTELPPSPDHPRLPEGVPQAAAPSPAAATTGPIAPPPASFVSNGLDYTPLNVFFQNHMVIKNKMVHFLVDQGKATLYVSDFPWQNIPAPMRQTLDTKIQALLGAVGEGAHLDVKDASTRDLLVAY